MDLSELSGLVLVVVGVVLLVTAVQLYTFWASEALLAAGRKIFDVQIAGLRRSLPGVFSRRRKTA